MKKFIIFSSFILIFFLLPFAKCFAIPQQSFGDIPQQAQEAIQNSKNSNSKTSSLPPGCEQTGSESNISFTCNTGLGIKIIANPQDFTRSFFGIILSISGAVALLLIIVSGYRLMASGGNPEKVKGAREQLTSAVVGLLFVIFSIVILQLIGVDVLMIPGFT